MPKKSALILLAALALSGCGEPEDTRPGQPVAHRRKAFKELLKAFEPMGVMLRTENYDATKFKALNTSFMALRDGPWEYFLADTLYPPSHAKPEVWSDATRFAAEKKTFFDATDRLAAITGTKDAKQVEVAYAAVVDSCNSCHKGFKTR